MAVGVESMAARCFAISALHSHIIHPATGDLITKRGKINAAWASNRTPDSLLAPVALPAGAPYSRINQSNLDNMIRTAKFKIGQIVHHRVYPFRGVVFDVDPEFDNTEEWYQSIPEDVRPIKDQPFYHLLAENQESAYVAYVSEQNLLPDRTGAPVEHPQIDEFFVRDPDGNYRARDHIGH